MSRKPSKFNDPIRDAREKPASPEKPRTIDFSILSEEKKTELTQKARAKVDAQAILDAEQAFLQSEMDRLDKLAHPEAFEEQKEIYIDLALYADRITLDGKTFWHGATYTVPKGQYDVIMNVMQGTHRHEAEITSGDEYSKFYRRERARTVNGVTGVIREGDGRISGGQLPTSAQVSFHTQTARF